MSIPLRGAGGEPVSFAFTIRSHGLAALPPAVIHPDLEAYDYTLALDGELRTVRFTERDGALHVEARKPLTAAQRCALETASRRMFRLDDDLGPFYAMIAADESLAWAGTGAGRMLASPTVFEDVIRTICTTNCAWSATTRMICALVALGEGAFPSPEKLARTPERWYADVARMGYRGAYVRAIARDVLAGLNLEELLPRGELAAEEVEERLLELPGVGPYAAAHIMQLLGYHERLILDSWTRPTFLKLTGMKRATDTTIRRRFSRYGPYAGLAFWLFLTRRWHAELL